MPLTEKGQEIEKALQQEYGKEKGESILYAGGNKGTFTGIHDSSSRRARLHAALDRVMDGVVRYEISNPNGRGHFGSVITQNEAEARKELQRQAKEEGGKLKFTNDDQKSAAYRAEVARYENEEGPYARQPRFTSEAQPSLTAEEERTRRAAVERASSRDPRAARLHAALDCVMDRCGYGKDAEPGSWRKHAETPEEKRQVEEQKAYTERIFPGPNPASEFRKTKDAYRLTARDQGFLTALLNGVTELGHGVAELVETMK